MDLKIKIVNKSNNPLPEYSTENSSGMDLRADLSSFSVDELYCKPMQSIIIPTGLFMAIPPGYEGQIRPRSGLAAKHSITVLNTPGTIDADYRGEVKVILKNLGLDDFRIQPGDRICQMVFAPVCKASFDLTDTLDNTERGAGGFGHSGVS